jgi:hypothetical protein
LFPHETHLVKLNEELDRHAPAAALIRLQHNGKPGDIVTTGFVLDLKNGYSSTFIMHDPKLMRSSILAGAHIRFGQPDPSEGFPTGTTFTSPLLLANVSDKPVTAHVSVDYTVAEKLAMTPIDAKQGDTEDQFSNVAVKDVTIAPGDVQKIELSEEISRFNINGPVKEAGVEIAFDGAPGALIAVLTSVDQSGDYSFEVPIKDPSAIGEWPQGVYPWTLEGGVATTLHLKNFTDKSQSAQLEIRYEGGTYNPKMLVLAPHQTIAIDIRKLKDSRTPDERGQVIPANVTHGQLWWGPRALMTIIGRNEEVNVTQGIARSFSCSDTCCGTRNANFQMVPGSATMDINGDARPFVSQEQDSSCIGNGFTCSGGYCWPNYQWSNWYNTSSCYWSSDSSVATIVNGSSYYGGNAEITTGSTGGNANISITCDWSQDTYMWDPDSRMYVCGWASPTGSASAKLTVLPPDHLVVLNDVTGTRSGCSGTVIDRKITFAVVDQPGNQVTNLPPVQEQAPWPSITGNTCPSHALPTQAPCVGAANGSFVDEIANDCSSADSSCGYTLTDEWQWCPGPGNFPVNIGKLNDVVDGNQVTVNGSVSPQQIPIGTPIYP